MMLDACMGVPDLLAVISILHCCDAHDQALAATMDWSAFDPANSPSLTVSGMQVCDGLHIRGRVAAGRR